MDVDNTCKVRATLVSRKVRYTVMKSMDIFAAAARFVLDPGAVTMLTAPACFSSKQKCIRFEKIVV